MSPAAPNLTLTLGINDYDHVRDLASGTVSVRGIDLRCMLYDVEEIFYRFTKFREWEISELSMGKFTAIRSRGDDSLVGIPVFPSRLFRHSGIYVRSDGPVDDPAALRSGRIGIPEWTVTATVYGRDVLAKEYGVGLTDVVWVQGGTSEPGRIETLSTAVPDGVRIEPVRDRSLTDLLLAGEIDAILAPHPPHVFGDGSGRIVRLFSDVEAVERDYYARTGIFPIMHVIAIRGDTYRANRWIAANLMTAFEEARDRAVARATDFNASRAPIAWANAHADAIAELFGGDPWPYGIEPNRTTLEAFLGMCHEQRLTERLLTPEELFVDEVQSSFRV